MYQKNRVERGIRFYSVKRISSYVCSAVACIFVPILQIKDNIFWSASLCIVSEALAQQRWRKGGRKENPLRAPNHQIATASECDLSVYHRKRSRRHHLWCSILPFCPVLCLYAAWSTPMEGTLSLLLIAPTLHNFSATAPRVVETETARPPDRACPELWQASVESLAVLRPWWQVRCGLLGLTEAGSI